MKIKEKKTTKKRIGIDARFYGPAAKGLGRYTKEITDRVIRDSRYEYVVFLSPDNFDELDVENLFGVKKVLVKTRWYSVLEQIIFPWQIWRERIDLMHYLHFNVPIFAPTKFIVTIHDLILTKFPTIRATTLNPAFYWFKNLMYKLVIWLAVKRAKKVIAVSKFTEDDIRRQFKVKGDKVITIYEGVAEGLKINEKIDDKKILLGYNIHKPYLMYVGNAYPHKNLEGLIKIFSKISKKYSEFSLVLVGKADYFYTQVKNFAAKTPNKDKIIFPGYVPDEDLAVLYRHARAYIFASFYEGFGLPPLEAMAHSCPVVSSDKACMPEVLESAALYFNPENKADMQAKIEKIIESPELRTNLISRGQEQVKKYSWNKATQEVLNLYNKF